MKIETNLRTTLRAWCEVNQSNYETKRRQTVEAIAGFRKKNKKAGKELADAERKYSNAKKQEEQAKSVFEKYGLSHYRDDQINDEGAFLKHGGVLPQYNFWKYSTLIAKLASLDEKEGAKFIRSLGIVWE